MYFGIDFSGGADAWKARCLRPTVWIAAIKTVAAPQLVDLRPVQSLPGEAEPFAKLVTLLGSGDYAAAGIDAPFAIPAEHLPPGGHVELLARVQALSPAADRPFPLGEALVELAASVAPLRKQKPYRQTDRVWIGRGINTRSTLWNGPRGGAPFTAACLTLLARAGRPVWPWNFGPGMLVEAFPAAQLRVWGLPHSGYSKPEQHGRREQILVGLAKRLDFTDAQRASMLQCPDALDAVIAAFAAIAAERQGAPATCPADGLIAVVDDNSLDTVGATAPSSHNLFRFGSDRNLDELFEEVMRLPGVRIERIVSRGHTTPPDKPYVQDWDEWVLVLAGSARLVLNGSEEHSLMAGEHLLIPAGTPHLVTFTADPTIWLAVHTGGP